MGKLFKMVFELGENTIEKPKIDVLSAAGVQDQADVQEVGRVLSVGDGIARIYGLKGVKVGRGPLEFFSCLVGLDVFFSCILVGSPPNLWSSSDCIGRFPQCFSA